MTIFFFWFSAAQESGTTIDSLTTVGDEPRRYHSPIHPPTSRLADLPIYRITDLPIYQSAPAPI
ncbi:MAG: hypothetical protein ACK4I8_03430 [Armatimonadota bacterium]